MGITLGRHRVNIDETPRTADAGQMHTRVLVLLLALSVHACTSALKKRCEETNWYDHGVGVALSGKYPASDTFVQQCHKEEAHMDESQLSQGFQAGRARYCTSEGALNTGKQGMPLNIELCDGASIKALREQHAQGVLIFCQASNGYPFGSTGKTYDGICPKDLEVAFLKEYKRGRRGYLQNEVLLKEQRIVQLEREQHELERDGMELQNRLNALTTEQLFRERTLAGAPEDERRRERSNFDWRRNDLNREISSKSGQANGKRAERARTHEEIEALKREIQSLSEG